MLYSSSSSSSLAQEVKRLLRPETLPGPSDSDDGRGDQGDNGKKGKANNKGKKGKVEVQGKSKHQGKKGRASPTACRNPGCSFLAHSESEPDIAASGFCCRKCEATQGGPPEHGRLCEMLCGPPEVPVHRQVHYLKSALSQGGQKSEGVPAEEAAEEAAEEPPKRQRLSWRCPVVGGGGDSITDSYSAAAARGLAARVLAKRQTVDQTDLVQKVVDQHVASWWQHELMKGLEAEEASSPSFGMCEELASSPEPIGWTPERIRKLEAFGLAVADAVANIATSRFCTSVTSAATSLTGPGVDPPHQSHQPHHQAEATVRVDPEHQPHPFVQLKQADGYKSVVLFSKISHGVRKHQLGHLPDGTVCRIDEIDEDSASFRISHEDWNGWIASRNATSVTGVDPLAQSSSGVIQHPWRSEP
jgi:hypothetical protein